MKYLIKSFVLLLVTSVFTFVITACGGGSSNSSSEKEILFTQSAERVLFSEMSPGTFLLSMENVSSATNFFSDRSTKDEPFAGTISTTQFVADWDKPGEPNNFTNNPPNAALEGFDVNGNSVAIALQLQAPLYNSSQNLLTYRANIIERFPPAYGSNLVTDSIPTELTRASLFIDDSKADFDDQEKYRENREECFESIMRDLSEGGNEFFYSIQFTLESEPSCKALNLSSDTVNSLNQFSMEIRGTRGDCGSHGSCGQIQIGTTYFQCVHSCKNVGCDIAYNGGTCWCSGWCASRFNPIPVSKPR